ncbi:winged helix-turn-helix domain-containing protein [Chromobacterium haemolyticum]|uniref:winged helix-turn-helix domain-containing protein n=1 Tax=Chromobacterium haemolyticum TaxID=394935 RepID=UPI00405752EB
MPNRPEFQQISPRARACAPCGGSGHPLEKKRILLENISRQTKSAPGALVISAYLSAPPQHHLARPAWQLGIAIYNRFRANYLWGNLKYRRPRIGRNIKFSNTGLRVDRKIIKMRFHIEDKVVFDPDEGSLLPWDQDKIILKYNEALLLKLLLSGLFEKNELIENVWGKTIVTDSSYHKLVFDLRAQLEKSGLDPKIIKTIPRRGCQFVGAFVLLEPQADADAPSPALEAGPQEPRPAPAPQRRKARWRLPARIDRRQTLAALAIIALGLLLGWHASWWIPQMNIHKMRDGARSLFVVGNVYRDAPKLPESGGDAFYIKSGKCTASYLCDKKYGSDLNCKNKIVF